MSIMEIRINNTSTTRALSLDLKFDDRRQSRPLIAPSSYVNVADICTLDELNRLSEIQRLRTSGAITVTTVPSATDEDIDELEAGPLKRLSIAADSTLTADVIGAATETAHTAITLPYLFLNKTRRVVKFRGRLHVIAANAADTWTFRVRLGGLTGAVLVASAAIDIVTNDVFEVSGTIELRTLGASGTFDSVVTFLDIVNDAADVDTVVLAGTIVTTADVSLVVTGTCSSNNAGNQVSLRNFSAEIYAA